MWLVLLTFRCRFLAIMQSLDFVVNCSMQLFTTSNSILFVRHVVDVLCGMRCWRTDSINSFRHCRRFGLYIVMLFFLPYIFHIDTTYGGPKMSVCIGIWHLYGATNRIPQLQRRFCVTDRADVQPIGRTVQARVQLVGQLWTLAGKIPR